MEEKRYELRILPLFEEKFQETADYIAFRLIVPARIRENQALGFGPVLLYDFGQITSAINKRSHFHHMSDYHIKHEIVLDRDSIIYMLAIFL